MDPRGRKGGKLELPLPRGLGAERGDGRLSFSPSPSWRQRSEWRRQNCGSPERRAGRGRRTETLPQGPSRRTPGEPDPPRSQGAPRPDPSPRAPSLPAPGGGDAASAAAPPVASFPLTGEPGVGGTFVGRAPKPRACRPASEGHTDRRRGQRTDGQTGGSARRWEFSSSTMSWGTELWVSPSEGPSRARPLAPEGRGLGGSRGPSAARRVGGSRPCHWRRLGVPLLFVCRPRRAWPGVAGLRSALPPLLPQGV